MGLQPRTVLFVGLLFGAVAVAQHQPEGNYAFSEALPGDSPPRIRRPPYVTSNTACPGVEEKPLALEPPDLFNNLCGDLNKGQIPMNPMGQKPTGQSYPFELIRNKTLEFLRTALPNLKGDDKLPRVTKYNGPLNLLPRPPHKLALPLPHRRLKRQIETKNITGLARNFIPHPPHPFLHSLHSSPKAIRNEIADLGGRPSAGAAVETREKCKDMICWLWDKLSWGGSRTQGMHRNGIETNEITESSGPPTPCPSVAEYATPLFAKNYQGIWRYVVQIPYEGYFTQTVELTRCLQRRCKYLEGACMSSARWLSLLAAEIFYPNSFHPSLPPLPKLTTPAPHFDAPIPPVYDFQNFQQYLNIRAGHDAFTKLGPSRGPIHTGLNPADQSPTQQPYTTVFCDGYDQNGCFQIRMFYDWFLVPGACKCWKLNARNPFTTK